MLKISEKYSLEKDAYSWRLDIKIMSTHHKSKKDYVIQSRWYPTVSQALAYVLDEELKQADGTLVELANRLEEVTEEVKNLAKSWEKKYR